MRTSHDTFFRYSNRGLHSAKGISWFVQAGTGGSVLQPKVTGTGTVDNSSGRMVDGVCQPFGSGRDNHGSAFVYGDAWCTEDWERYGFQCHVGSF